jgi:hypothetical protein
MTTRLILSPLSPGLHRQAAEDADGPGFAGTNGQAGSLERHDRSDIMARTIPSQTSTSPGQAGTAPDQAGTAPSRTGTAPDHAPSVLARRGLGAVVGLVAALAVIVAGVFGLTALHLLPHLRNPFAEATTVRSQPPLLKSITSLSRYQAASGSFQVIVNLSRKTPYLPSFIEGSDTLFVGQGTVAAYDDFSQLGSRDIQVSRGRTAVTVRLPEPQLGPAALDVRQSYVFAQQQGLLNRIGNFFSGNPNSQQQVYILAQQRIQAAAGHSPLLAQARTNTRSMLTGMLHALGFKQVTVIFASSG